MIDLKQELAERYSAALKDYLAGAEEEALKRGYELGRKAIADGVGVLEMAAIHNNSLAAVITDLFHRPDAIRAAALAAAFFAESLSPFEMVMRGYREANARLRTNLNQLEAVEQELQQQNQELAAAHQVVKAEQLRYQELFHFAPSAYLVTDLKGTIREGNYPATKLLAMDKESLLGKPLVSFIIEEDKDFFRVRMEKLETGEADGFTDWEISARGEEGRPVPISLRVEVVRNSRGDRIGLRWLVTDISERKRIEEERAELRIREHIAQAEIRAVRSLKFLAEASGTLAASLSYETILNSIGHLAISHLAEFCVVHLVEGQDSILQVAAFHADPLAGDQVARLHQYLLGRKSMAAPLAEILASKHSKLIQGDLEGCLKNIVNDEEPLEILRQFKLKSMIFVPLLGEEEPLGTLWLSRSEYLPRYGLEDQELAELFAQRCSLVLDNAKLHAQVVIERDKAGMASQVKDEFVATLSHELRTPLTVILGWARILQKQAAIMADPMLREGVEALEHNARNVARQVEDCLDISRITMRKIHLHSELQDLNQIVKATLEATREATSEKDFHFLVHLSQEALWVMGDRTRLEQVVSNLLSNAFRYTGKGGLVSISSSTVDQEAEIVVQDTGIGIERHFLEQIFQPFRQGTQQWLASESGLGLGLAIAREIVQMHKGKVWAESQGPGCGSTFRFRIPLVLDKTQDLQQPATSIPEPPKNAALRVLFVEDSADVLNLMRIEMEDAGFTVLTVMDGASGLAVAQRDRPDVIISDIKMPGMDGYEFIRKLRQIPGLASTPTIALTGFGMNQDIEKALAAGYTAHLFKPVEAKDLANLIKTLVSR